MRAMTGEMRPRSGDCPDALNGPLHTKSDDGLRRMHIGRILMRHDPEHPASRPCVKLGLGAARQLALAFALLIPSMISAQDAAGHQPLTIGRQDGQRPLVFGNISAVAPTPDRGVLVLDMTHQELRWFDESARHIASVGQNGRGPGGLRQPNALAVTADGLVHVVDDLNQRISTFRLSPVEGTITHLRDTRLPFPVASICAIGQRLFVLTLGRMKLIHELDADGAVVRSFGDSEHPDAATLRHTRAEGVHTLEQLYNDGTLACDPVSRRVALVTSVRFMVRVFDDDGRALWRVVLNNADPQEILVTHGGAAVQVAPNRETGMRSAADGVAFNDRGDVVVTIMHERILAGNGTRTTYDRRTLRGADGGEYSSGESPGLIRAIAHGKYYATRNSPFPQVLIY